jgi:hypothetical protein
MREDIRACMSVCKLARHAKCRSLSHRLGTDEGGCHAMIDDVACSLNRDGMQPC